MNKKAHITLLAENKEHTVTVNLLDNEYVNFMIENHEKSGDWNANYIKIPSCMPYDADEIDSLWKSILLSYRKFLEIIAHQDLINPPEVFDNTNIYTNILHRIFTTYSWHNTYCGVEVDYTQEGRDVVEQMNVDIHELEKYIVNSTRDNYEAVSWIDIQGQISAENRYFFSDEELQNISTTHTVYCVKHILGKDHIIAYLDEDVPDAWDVQTSFISYCGFCIDFRGDIRRAWKEQKFTQWLGNNSPGYYPVGDMSKEDLLLLNELTENTKDIKVVEVNYE